LIPPLKLLTKEARKRLKAIEEFTELGSGFQLAMRDLEIRGAGNLLGAQQHGFIEEVGFDLYIKLLEEAVMQLTGQSAAEHFQELKITTDLDLFIPENYIDDSNQRVDTYRKFSAVDNQAAIDDLVQELTDRYGPVPEAITNLAHLAGIRVLAKSIGVNTLTLKRDRLTLEYVNSESIGRERIGAWVKAVEEKLEFKYGRNFIIQITLKESDDTAGAARNVLQKMQD
jgi:transcription-repair coupling factor (superfamily II helicase)